MGFWSSLLLRGRSPVVELAQVPAVRFDGEGGVDIPPQFYGLTSYASPVAPAGRVSRELALQVPAVKRCRDLIAGTLGTLPINLLGPDQALVKRTLLEQPEPDVARSVTMTRTYEDLLFEGVAWWRILEFGWHGYPTKVRRLDPRSVGITPMGKVFITKDGHVGSAQEWVADDELIRFDSPNAPLLIAGARAIRTALLLDAAAQRFAEGVPPMDYFTPSDGVDPADDDEIAEILGDWQKARQSRSTGYVPASLTYNLAGFNPEQLQMADARQHAVLEIARSAGVDPEDVGVAVTSRTYFNAFDKRKQFTDFTLGTYRASMEDRLSMGDITPRGYRARLNLDEFMRSDSLSRFQAYQAGLAAGALTPEEVRQMEGRPAITAPDIDSEEAQEDTVTNAAPQELVFDTEPAIRLDAPTAVAFEVDEERRTITGLAVPYGIPARSGGQLWQFSKGSLVFADPSRVKLWVQHDPTQAVGVATGLEDRDDGLYGTFKVARGTEGDRALALAQDGVLDGLSVGLGTGGKFTKRDGINHAVKAPLMEVSLTPAPSFDDARVHHVAASAATDTTKGSTMAVDTNPAPDAEAPEFSTITGTFTGEITPGPAPAAPADEAAADTPAPQASRASIPARQTMPAAPAFSQIREELPYRFDGTKGAHSFSADMRAMASGDSEARTRMEAFMAEIAPIFAVTTTGTGAINPAQQRPDLYVPSLAYARPLASLVTMGSLEDARPFVIPKFSAASGLVDDHTEGTEPTPGSFSTTPQTVTPAPLSGKVEINREVWDMGGSPQADQIIWTEMLNAYFALAEQKIADLLNASEQTETNLASAVDGALQAALLGLFAGLQFVQGGDRFNSFAADGKLYPAIVGAKDADGRSLFPILNPTNAQGTATATLDRVQVGGKVAVPAWALGSTNASKSYLFVKDSVFQWLSAPQQFTFQYQVKSVDVGLFGYHAEAVTRDTDIKVIDYTTADS